MHVEKRMRRGWMVAGVLAALAGGATAQVVHERPDEPRLINGELVYPNGLRIPRSLTPVEEWYIRQNPLVVPEGPNDPPTGPVLCPGEYGPMQAILIAWEGGSTLQTILTNMAVVITRTPTESLAGGAAQLWVGCDSAAVQSAATTTLTNAGVNMSRVRFFQRTLDTIWIRDYGPRYIYEGGGAGQPPGVRAIVDHVYNRPRPNDDAFPPWLGGQLKQPVYNIPLIHGGGNYHLSTLTDSYATRLIKNENPSLTEAQIIAHWNAFQAVDTHLFDPFPTSVDLTQHIDMWMQVTGDRAVVISDWPYNVGSTQDVICDAAAAFMTARGYTVTRVPARSLSGVHYTYTNVVMCNDVVLLTSYTNSGMTNAPAIPGPGNVNLNTVALDAWTAHLAGTGKRIVQINCEPIISLAGAMHCIVMHVPSPLGGVNPTAYLRTPNGGQSLNPGSNYQITWSTDDDVGVVNVDLRLSTDGGATYPTVIASAIPDTGSFNWTVPNVIFTSKARVKVMPRDAAGNTGFDASDANFTINGTIPCCVDYNEDEEIDFTDVEGFLAAYAAQVPGNCAPGADLNGDEEFDFSDIERFLALYNAGC